MVDRNKEPFGLGHWPRWKQFIAFVFAVMAGMAMIKWAGQAYDAYMGSPRARAIKAKMELLAQELDRAQRLGDHATVLALSEPTLKILNSYNGLDDGRKEKISRSPMRNCVLAAVHLASGVPEVLETGYWTSKSKYDAARDACK